MEKFEEPDRVGVQETHVEGKDADHLSGPRRHEEAVPYDPLKRSYLELLENSSRRHLW